MADWSKRTSMIPGLLTRRYSLWLYEVLSGERREELATGSVEQINASVADKRTRKGTDPGTGPSKRHL
jgi:hypothetical protein